jgi:hypothetical protein
MGSSSSAFGFKLQSIGSFFRRRRRCYGGLRVVLQNGFGRRSVSWVLRDLFFLLLCWGLQFAVCSDGRGAPKRVSGVFVDEDSLLFANGRVVLGGRALLRLDYAWEYRLVPPRQHRPDG